ncbi:MAG: carboxymuconolactone decarboxylase family protein [Solirubrobacterales bacterium]|nr:carboxymuconolactone decarboxylase family protein [Solirubrobacterales bacterium]
MTTDPAARIPPGTRAEIGAVNFAITRLLGAATGGAPPNLFTTLARHRSLFRRWLRFAGALMPGGLLPREDSELLILRVAHNCGCDYEWHHHERIALGVGLTAEEIQRVRRGPEGVDWSPRRAQLLAAADELHARHTISDTVWSQLDVLFSNEELIELCLLVGHYEMLAMTLNALQVAPDRLPAGRMPVGMRMLESIIVRRGRGAERSSS